ncbi:MAG TPA: PIN domain-containing protein [Longimicrobiales bacterium]
MAYMLDTRMLSDRPITVLIRANDLLIAAHALALEMTLVTANTREFARVPGLACDDWLAV